MRLPYGNSLTVFHLLNCFFVFSTVYTVDCAYDKLIFIFFCVTLSRTQSTTTFVRYHFANKMIFLNDMCVYVCYMKAILFTAEIYKLNLTFIHFNHFFKASANHVFCFNLPTNVFNRFMI